MTAAIWSTPPDKCGLGTLRSYSSNPTATLTSSRPPRLPREDVDPVRRVGSLKHAEMLTFLRPLRSFMHNHHLLQIADKPKWLVVKGGRSVRALASEQHACFKAQTHPLPLSSSSYIKPVISKLPPNCLHISTPIVSLKTSTVDRGSKSSPMVTIKTAAGEERVYDHVVMACHADQTLRILKAGGGVTDKEEEILGGFQFEQNSVVLHGDEKVSIPLNLFRRHGR